MAQPYQLMEMLPGMTIAAVLRVEDGAAIPFDERNRDYQDYLEWRAAGNEADPPPPAPL
jgi:hypothetical protein